MIKLNSAEITLESGVAGDFRGHPGKRQVTLLAEQDWQQACRQSGAQLPWDTRRANLLLSHLDLRESTGRLIQIGAMVVLEVTGETKPCQRMDEAWPGLRKALEPDWRGGVTARVVRGGRIQSGDAVNFIEKI